MSKALVDAILPTARTAVAPVPCEDYRLDPVQIPSVWIRPASSTSGRFATLPDYRDGLVTLDIWGASWSEVSGIEEALTWLDGYVTTPTGSVRSIRYRKESSVPVLELDAAHQVLTYSAVFFYMGVLE